MAKKSWLERNKRKSDTVKKYAAIRAELKAKRDYAGLAKLPRDERSSSRLSAQIWLFAYDVSRSRTERADSRSNQSQLVIFMSDPISDMLTRIRNASRALLPAVEMPHSRIKEGVAHILKSEGYVAEVSVDGKAIKKLKIQLKYQGKKAVIEGLKRVSKPGLRKYVGSTEIPRVLGGMGVSILSTSEGVMTGTQAKKKNLGGELLCYIW